MHNMNKNSQDQHLQEIVSNNRYFILTWEGVLKTYLMNALNETVGL